ncbi:hypothetical protein [Candidatus Nitronereus thalassa]|uniref:UDP-N-acetylglucosamine--undecaprenyl-phosphate N-acetylglucosaminephosphotransferase n=1 Tax=Candidatus Nitronereus thalassa TaxID=3020898 RepID=A0ABU3K5M9_9BACT|nr:hypothetical protein [Candidatus Nitronereus thalassa]MDT7041681.1 hypothetical protein [Candidatus Nitronereus thalassa]
MTLVELGIGSLVFLLAFLFTRGLSSPTSKLCLMDHPNIRSLHENPTPCTGGLAILVCALGGWWSWILLVQLQPTFLSVNRISDPDIRLALILSFFVALLTLISYWDRKVGVKPGLRLAIHILAGAALVRGADLFVNAISIPLLGQIWPLGWVAVPLMLLIIIWIKRLFGLNGGLIEGSIVLIGGFVIYVLWTGGANIFPVLSLIVSILCLVWMSNLFNFMDGMDGLAGGMGIIGFGFLSFIAWTSGHFFITSLAFFIAVSCGGFLVFNLPPARIFMGDVGSVPLGFSAGGLSALGIHQGLFDIWIPLLIFSPFIMDATVTLYCRMLRGEKVWKAHREHFYQRLVLSGWEQRKVLMAEYGLMLGSGMSAVMYGQFGEQLRFVVLLGWIFIYTLLGWGVFRIEQRAKKINAAA